MEELTTREVQDIEFEILKYFDAFCKEHNIRYFLAFGTLLGAIRYKKFIPWDDDVDVVVPREDYDRLLSIFQDSEQYHLFAPEKDQSYLFPFAKLCDMTTRKDEFGINNGVTLGIDIDIFPLDAWDNDPKKAKRETKRISRYIVSLGLCKMKRSGHKNPLKRLILNMLMIVSKLFGAQYFVKKLIKISNNPKQTGGSNVGAKVWNVYSEKGITSAAFFADAVDVEFEGQMFPAPIGYDGLLTHLYGDYMPEPPKEKQVTHHTFAAYRLEN